MRCECHGSSEMTIINWCPVAQHVWHAKEASLLNGYAWVPSIGQNLQPFADNGDVSKGVKNSRVGRKAVVLTGHLGSPKQNTSICILHGKIGIQNYNTVYTLKENKRPMNSCQKGAYLHINRPIIIINKNHDLYGHAPAQEPLNQGSWNLQFW